ncbi:hypothetical protein SD70_05290 [Gordoniibacillus kamchatkensis]|uniref:ChbG/HpnK family deacetylase n=1 Tax=Gordoniibacillus kamchatkensis TaxID=1590651 RepID=A0ABR5AL59_9BACL|nr:polysaccharide deacetylase family protein [Paenibacillus sp. VKM B-2647]KIL41774.1 hypothetical protein SD70_05290 [Paenibacillus sp. VKM B-2647]
MIECLGFDSNARLLIINADDFGLSPAANAAIIDLFRSSAITSASIMMPCPSAREAAKLCRSCPQASTGIHLTLTSTEQVECRPVFRRFRLDSLTTEEGLLPRDALAVEREADPDQVKLELEAQIRLALAMGIDPTHLDSHAGTVLGLRTGRDFLEVVFELCEKYGLPFLLPTRAVQQPYFTLEQRELFRKRIESARRRGIMLIDDLIALPYELEADETYERFKSAMIRAISNAGPGVTQIVIHPAAAGAGRAAMPHAAKRAMEYRLFLDPEFKRLFEREQIKLISWRQVRDLQRSLR